jgi:hypothetical protein
LLHMFWTSPFNASLSFFALTLVIGLIGTSNGLLAWLRLVLGWSASQGDQTWDYMSIYFSVEWNCRTKK